MVRTNASLMLSLILTIKAKKEQFPYVDLPPCYAGNTTDEANERVEVVYKSLEELRQITPPGDDSFFCRTCPNFNEAEILLARRHQRPCIRWTVLLKFKKHFFWWDLTSVPPALIQEPESLAEIIDAFLGNMKSLRLSVDGGRGSQLDQACFCEY